MSLAMQAKLKAHLTPIGDSGSFGSFDLVIAGRSFAAVPIQILPYDNILGFTFMSHLGVVGFNARTHQFILYH